MGPAGMMLRATAARGLDSRVPARAHSKPAAPCRAEAHEGPAQHRRSALLSACTLAACQALQPHEAKAVQGLTAGRIPGISADPELEGVDVYTRPEGKSGGHGVGWSEIPKYSFRIPSTWNEVPVSIADLGGTEIDVRFKDRNEGDLAIVVAPILRFRDIGYNANVDLDYLGTPDKIISGFAPELFGAPLNDGDVLDTRIYKRSDTLYYQWELKPHHLVTATATGNRIFLLAVSANSRQWRKAQETLRMTADSFYVPPAKNFNFGF